MMRLLFSRMMICGLLMSCCTGVVAVELQKKSVTDQSGDRSIIHQRSHVSSIEKYYQQLDQIIGGDPELVPFNRNSVSVKSGRTLIQIARKHTPVGLDSAHVAAALYLANRDAFQDDDVNHLIAGKALKLPTVSELFRASGMYEELLSKDKYDDAGYLMYSDPLPRQGKKMVSARKQGRLWKKLSEHKFSKPPILGPEALSGTLRKASETASTDDISVTSDGAFGIATVEAVSQGEEICPFCGLPMQVVKRGKLKSAE